MWGPVGTAEVWPPEGVVENFTQMGGDIGSWDGMLMLEMSLLGADDRNSSPIWMCRLGLPVEVTGILPEQRWCLRGVEQLGLGRYSNQQRDTIATLVLMQQFLCTLPEHNLTTPCLT